MTLGETFSALLFSLLFTLGGLGVYKGADEAEEENLLRAQISNWPQAEAKILSGHVSYSKTSGRITTKYTYEYDGERYTSDKVGFYDSEDAPTLFKEKIQYATYIDCYVNPLNPEESYLFNCQTEDESPMVQRLCGLAITGTGLLIFYFSFIHRFVKKKVSSTSSKKNNPGSQTIATPTSSKMNERGKSVRSITSLKKIVNNSLNKADWTNNFNSDKCKIEAIIWMFCISDIIMREAYSKVLNRQNGLGFHRDSIDYIKHRSLSIACSAIIQKLGLGDLKLKELSKLYWNRFSMYSNMKKEHHFITLFSILISKNSSSKPDTCPKITVNAINKLTLEKSNLIISAILKWMLHFCKDEIFIEIFNCSTSLFERHAQWVIGLKDEIDGKIYACCNRCALLCDVKKLVDLACPACNARLEKYMDNESKRFSESGCSGLSFRINYNCKHCGHEYSERGSNIHHYRLCYSCFNKFSKNFEGLNKRLYITNK